MYGDGHRFVDDERVVSRAELEWLLYAWWMWQIDVEAAWSPLWRSQYRAAKAAWFESRNGCDVNRSHHYC